MSSVAQKLCEKIYEETSTRSFKHGIKSNTPNSVSFISSSTSNRYKGRPTNSIIVEKKREINKVLPKTNAYRNKIVINKFKSKETLLKKKFVDVSSNTIKTGPLKCDNDCVTIVRRRDSKCTCGQKRNKFLFSTKDTQTLNFKHHPTLDKASARCVSMINCAVQEENKHSMNKISKAKLVYDVDVQTSFNKNSMKRQMQDKSAGAPIKTNTNNMVVRRWAISKGPARGPDF
ncbi:unnamed protein product [Diatraea saccharalis]|uniref:Uncharacterized protein n=1 Tax=Diatraea saccharalis TaxID=40085 RepID=A0A9N9RBF5_9NEOP|nr:unnamed protein product [Diatraea saccharalis]